MRCFYCTRKTTKEGSLIMSGPSGIRIHNGCPSCMELIRKEYNEKGSFKRYKGMFSIKGKLNSKKSI